MEAKRPILKAAAALAIACSAGATNSASVTAYYQPTPYPSNMTHGIHVVDGWLPSYYYGKTFQQDERLQIGGWGDQYRTYIQFDLTGLPDNVTNAALLLYAYPRGDNSSMVNFSIARPNTQWTENNLTTNMSWQSQPTSFTLLGNYVYGPSTGFWSIGITSTYNNWKSRSIPNYGLAIFPRANNNNFDVWRSSRYRVNDGQRPLLQLTFTPPVAVPDFKIPLPRNVSWLVTTEPGGWDCLGAYDKYHDGNDYFSVDFNWDNKGASGNRVYGNPRDGALIPVTPAASGRVVKVGTDRNDPNGFYVVISHDFPNYDVSRGFSTRYLHLKDLPAVKMLQDVTQGTTLLGYMGSTGVSTGPHLHFGMRYNNSGAESSNVKYALLSRWLMKSFQTECYAAAPIRYYLSS